MANKLGFSTGKGFIKKVDSATNADNATNAIYSKNAEVTDFTNNGEWIEYTGDEAIQVIEGKTYECICSQVVNTDYGGSTLETYADQFIFTVPPAYVFGADAVKKVKLWKWDSRVYYLADPVFYENPNEQAEYYKWVLYVPAPETTYMTVKVYLREIR